MKNSILKHLAIILDGNRRYAKKKKLPVVKGHEFGAEKVEKLLDWCKEFNIKELTLYTLSIENLNRNKKEVSYLFNLIKKWLEKFQDNQKIKDNQIKVSFIGNSNLLPKEMKKVMKRIERKTENYKKRKLNFCVAYGGRQEIISCFNKLKNKKGKITQKKIKDNLWLKDEPDLIIRTGDRFRTSNFLPFQSVYSEWLFLKKLWPEFNKKDLKKAIEKFKSRKRNFGK